ncbi:MAG: arylesterase [Rhodobacteraceae bacterium]|nr:arylesterase [Paracoccaceae bacterium]
MLQEPLVVPAAAPATPSPSYGARALLSKLALSVSCLLLPLAAPAQTVVVALGDSLTQGYGLPEEEGFVPRLQGWLRERGHDVMIVNAGVSGDTTAGGLARVDWTLTGDVDAVIVALGGNDLLRGIDPASSRDNLDGVLSAIGERGLPVLLAGMTAPGNYGPEFKRDFDAMYPELAEEHGALLYPFFLEGLSERRALGEARALMQSDGLHPSAAGVAAIVEHMGPMVERLLEQVPQHGQGAREG